LETKEKQEQNGGDKPPHPQPGPDVTIKVDSNDKTVHRGSWVISELKTAVGVSADRALDEVVNGELKPLDDNSRVTIKGGEVFISHARQGGSS
jgi:hypothetical protein